jgi:hypothetical protein
MKSICLDDLTYQPLRVPAGWTMSYSSFYEVDPGSEVHVKGLPEGSAWALFNQDMLQMSNAHYDVVLDMGWVPDQDPNGSFVVQVIRGTDWDNPLAEFESRSRPDVVQWIESILRDVSAGKYPRPPKPKARGK